LLSSTGSFDCHMAVAGSDGLNVWDAFKYSLVGSNSMVQSPGLDHVSDLPSPTGLLFSPLMTYHEYVAPVE
jgi:hypothetical protein